MRPPCFAILWGVFAVHLGPCHWHHHCFDRARFVLLSKIYDLLSKTNTSKSNHRHPPMPTPLKSLIFKGNTQKKQKPLEKPKKPKKPKFPGESHRRVGAGRFAWKFWFFWFFWFFNGFCIFCVFPLKINDFKGVDIGEVAPQVAMSDLGWKRPGLD